MNKTKIETSEYTWNAVTGCDNICFEGDCYAYQMIGRFGNTWGYDWTPQIHENRLNEPIMVKEPSLIFAPSMGDLFTPSLKHDQIQTILDIMNKCPQHRFQVQTKFPERLNHFDYPSNIWLGVSLCYERDVSRLDVLKKTNARIKYAYCEPLLEDMEPDFTMIDWVVIGAKTGARPVQPDQLWVRKLTLLAYDAGAKVFHKPNLQFVKLGGSPMTQFPDHEWFDSRRR